MLSSVLNSERAVQVNIEIMRAFVKLRELIASNKELAKRLDDLEKKYDSQFKVVFDAIRELMTPPDPSPAPLPPQPARRIGFHTRRGGPLWPPWRKPPGRHPFPLATA